MSKQQKAPKSLVGKFARVRYLDHSYFHGEGCFVSAMEAEIPTWTAVGLVIKETDQALWMAMDWTDESAHLSHGESGDESGGVVDYASGENHFVLIVRGAIIELEVLGKMERV